MKKTTSSSIFLHAAGAAPMQCFSHFRRDHLGRGPASNGATVKSVSYESDYSDDLGTADRYFVFDVRLASALAEGSAFSFMAPAHAGQVKSVTARANGEAIPTTMRRRGDRTEI